MQAAEPSAAATQQKLPKMIEKHPPLVASDGPGSCELDGTVDEEAYRPAWEAAGVASWWEELCSAVPDCERASDDVRSDFRPGAIGLCCTDMVGAENKGAGMQVARTARCNKCANKQLQACGIIPPTTLLCRPNTPTAHASS